MAAWSLELGSLYCCTSHFRISRMTTVKGINECQVSYMLEVLTRTGQNQQKTSNSVFGVLPHVLPGQPRSASPHHVLLPPRQNPDRGSLQ